MIDTHKSDRDALVQAIGIFGGDVARWPDRDMARRAMEAALADREVRAHLDEARLLDRGLAAVRGVLDDEIAGSGAVQRIVQAATASVAPRPFGRLRWLAAVAVLICAAGLGSVADIGLANDDPSFQVVVVDPLVFGPMAGDDL